MNPAKLGVNFLAWCFGEFYGRPTEFRVFYTWGDVAKEVDVALEDDWGGALAKLDAAVCFDSFRSISIKHASRLGELHLFSDALLTLVNNTLVSRDTTKMSCLDGVVITVMEGEAAFFILPLNHNLDENGWSKEAVKRWDEALDF